MKMSALALLLLLALSPVGTFGFETDQFNLPPVPLADIGDEVSAYVEASITAALDDVNVRINKSRVCIEGKIKDKTCGSRENEQEQLAYLQSDEGLVKEVFKRLGDGNIFRTKFGKWINSHQFESNPARFKTSYVDSIYLVLPANYLTISPTVKMFGIEFGSDKLEHLFQQGYSYYKLRNDAKTKGIEGEEAITAAVEWGKRTERTYYGLLVSGVYSNADLYANYAGMRFYDGLTQNIDIGETGRAAIAIRENGGWMINEPATLRDRLIKPFISEHLNEALNPSGYSFVVYPTVRRVVRKNACREWHERYPELTAAVLAQKATDLELWNDEDYGNMAKGRLLKLSEVCFDAKRPS
jgi:hypothetical protein